MIVAGEARASSLRAVADALGGAQVTFWCMWGFDFLGSGNIFSCPGLLKRWNMFLSGRRRCKSGCSRELCEGAEILKSRIFTSWCTWIWQLTSSQGVRRAGEGDEHFVTAGKCRRCHRHGHSGDPETCVKFNKLEFLWHLTMFHRRWASTRSWIIQQLNQAKQLMRRRSSCYHSDLRLFLVPSQYQCCG